MIKTAEEGWFTRERILTLTLAFATFLFLYLSFRLIETFVPAIAFAIAVAVATQGPYGWLRARVKSDTSAALLAVLLVTLLILGPAAFLGTYIVQKGIENVHELRSGGAWTDWHTVVGRQPILGPMLIWGEQNLDLVAAPKGGRGDRESGDGISQGLGYRYYAIGYHHFRTVLPVPRPRDSVRLPLQSSSTLPE
jgi:hypothetical protein